VAVASASPSSVRAVSIAITCKPDTVRVRNALLAREPRRLDHALDAAVAEAARHDDPVQMPELRRDILLLKLLGIDPLDVSRARCGARPRDAATLER